jgi:hypothetical protein
MPNPTTETSVTISLADLARIEHERVTRENAERAQGAAQRLRREREAEAARRAEAQARVIAQEEACARRAREEAVEKARLEARELAAVEVARIQAEANARLAVDSAVRAHELDMLRVRRETGRRHREYVLGAALALLTCVGAAATYSNSERFSELERTAMELRDRERALAAERDDARRTELAALDRRHTALLSQSFAGVEEARKTAEEARRTIGERAPGHERLRAFADALDAFETGIENVEKLQGLDRRSADLAAWAASMRRKDVTDAIQRATSVAKKRGTDAEAVAAYERELDQVRDRLAPRGAVGRNRPAGEVGPTPGRCYDGDPSCGLDGKPLL